MIIGVDPGVRACGLAVLDECGGIIELGMMHVLDADKYHRKYPDATWVIEDLSSKHVSTRARGRAALKVAQDIGAVRHAQEILVMILTRIGADFVLAKPLKGELKKYKKDSKAFSIDFKCKLRSNEHKRDAACLAFHYLRLKENGGK